MATNGSEIVMTVAPGSENATSKIVAHMSNGLVLQNIVTAMKDLVKEVNIDANDAGLQVQSTDSSNVCLIHLMVNSNAFEFYRCEGQMTLGVNIEQLAKVLKLCGPTDKLTMEANDSAEGAGKVFFKFESPTGERMAQFELHTKDVSVEALGIPDQKYHVSAKIPTHVFKKAIADLNDVGDVVMLSATNEGVKVSVDGDMGSGEVLLQKKDSIEEKEADRLTIDLEQECSLKLGMRFIHLFTKASALCKHCVLNMTQNEPMVLHYSLAEETHGFLRFLLAPKLDD